MKKDVMILGNDAVYSCDTEKTGLNNNVLVVAGTGCGKTMSIIESRLLTTTESSLVVTCTKRQLVDKYSRHFRSIGYEVGEINFCKPQHSTLAYDPLSFVTSYQDIAYLASCVVKADPQKATNRSIDPYWDQTSCSLLSALISMTLMTKKHPSFSDVLDYFDRLTIYEDGRSITTSLDNIFNNIEKQDPQCFAIVNWRNFAVLPKNTAGCVYSTLASTISTIFTPELRKMMRMSRKINFRELATKKMVLFVTTSAVNSALYCFISTFYSQMFKQLFEFGEEQADGRLPLDVTVIADDFATGAPVQNMSEYISIFRAKGISTVLLIQSESQLTNLYNEAAATCIINNSDTYVFMGGNDLQTAQNISRRADRPLQDILWMPIGKEFIFRRGSKPVETSRYDICNDPMYQKVTKAYEKRVKAQKAADRRMGA